MREAIRGAQRLMREAIRDDEGGDPIRGAQWLMREAIRDDEGGDPRRSVADEGGNQR